MKAISQIPTLRTVLRPWRAADLVPFAALNADPRVAEYFPATLSRAESDAMAASIEQHFAQHGFGLWALEIPGRVPFAGFVGLTFSAFERPFAESVDVAWRVAAEHWGHGYATEAAAAALQVGFQRLGMARIVSCTVPANQRSRRVMERLGMTRDLAADFEHPRLPAGHPLKPHLLYRMERKR